MLISTKARVGFTLIELLLVIGIIAILASIVIVAVNPSKQLGDARNSQRRADINAILNAVYQYAIDNNGALPNTQITTYYTGICRDQTDPKWKTGACTALNLRILTGTYLVKMPVDPYCATVTGTGSCYLIKKDATSNRITVTASGVEVNGTRYRYTDSAASAYVITVSR